MDAKKLLAEALAGELIQSLDRDVDADAEAAWSEEIRSRLDRLDAGAARTIPWSEARRRIHAAAGRGRSSSHSSLGGNHRDHFVLDLIFPIR
jgi:hypothetical protein